MSSPLQFVPVPGFSALTSTFVTSRSRFIKVCTKRQSPTHGLPIRASQLPNGESTPNGDTGSQADDAELQRELRAKVKELFGSSDNVSILVTGDRAEFTVRQSRNGQGDSEYKSALATVTSIAVISILAGVLFSYLYFSGAVHGAPQPERRYDMPQFSTSSYIDPYELLEAEGEQL